MSIPTHRKDIATAVTIEKRIHLIRAQRVVIAKDLAELYGVTTHRLNEQVNRNRERFPPDSMFQLTIQEISTLRSQTAILETKGKGSHLKYLPYALRDSSTLLMLPLMLRSHKNILNIPTIGF